MQLIKQILLRSSGFLLNNRESKVIFYHDVFSSVRYTDMGTSFALFKKHQALLSNYGFRCVTTIANSINELQICFDDGFAGIWDCRQYWEGLSWRPTIFIAIELIGKPGYLDWLKIKELQQEGFRFQAHGWRHCVLTGLNNDDLDHETTDAKHCLEDALCMGVDEICFPVGRFSPKVMDSCHKAGYGKMYSSIPGIYNKPVFPNVIRRNLVQSYSDNDFKAVLFGGLIPFAQRYFRMHFEALEK